MHHGFRGGGRHGWSFLVGGTEERNFGLGTIPDKITEIYRWTKQVLLRGWTAAMHSAGHRKVLNRSHGPFFSCSKVDKKKNGRKKVLRAVVGFDSEGLPVPLVGDRRPPATGAAVKRKKRPICRTRKMMEAQVTGQSAICGLDWVPFLQGCFFLVFGREMMMFLEGNSRHIKYSIGLPV